MPGSLIVFTPRGTASVANVTRYIRIAGFSNYHATEANREITFNEAGTLSHLTIYVQSETQTATVTWRTRKNRANGGQSVAFAATGRFEDTTGTDTVASGNEFDYQYAVTGDASGVFTLSFASLRFHPTTTTNGVTLLATNHLNINVASTTRYDALNTELGGNTTEANANCEQLEAGTFKYLQIHIETNARTTTTTFRTRKNSANGAQSIAVTTQTGIVQDTTNTDTVASGDNFNYQWVSGTGTQSMPVALAVVYLNTAGIGQYVCARSDGFIIDGNDADSFLLIQGHIGNVEYTTEAHVETEVPDDYQEFWNLTLNVSANTMIGGSNSIIVLRRNVTSTALSITITPGATGIISNIVNFADTYTNDNVCFMINPAGTASEDLTLRAVSVTSVGVLAQNITRAVPTETITIGGGTLAELAAKIRTRTETAIVISENRARLSAKMRPLATQTTTLSENVIRVKGKVKTLVTETITVTGGTLARLLAKIRTGSDTTAIAENRARLAAKNRALAAQTIIVTGGTLAKIKGAVKAIPQTLAVGENLARLSTKIRALATQTTTVGAGTAARLKASLRPLAVQTVTIGENLARIKGILRSIATQTVTVGAGSIARLSVKIRALSLQTIVLTEDLQRTLTAGAQNIVKTITQTITLGESIARLKASQRTIPETITIGAGTIARLSAKIRTIPQTIITSENAARLSVKVRALATQTVIIADNRARIKGAVKTISQSNNYRREYHKTISKAQGPICSDRSNSRQRSKTDNRWTC